MIGQFPYQVALRTPGEPDGLAFCGGSIVDRHWVLTAHCFWDYKDDEHKISGLTTTEKDVEIIPGGVTDLVSQQARDVTLRVEKIIVHQEYNIDMHSNDIALLKVAEDLLAPKAGVTPEAITLAKPEQRDDFVGQPANVTGYGWTTNHGNGKEYKGSRYLMHTMISIQPDDKCHGGPFRGPYTIYNKDVMICAAVLEGGHAPCLGDSGGPLVVKGVQVGVLSFTGLLCDQADIPAVSARVSKFHDYIHDVINGKITEGKKEQSFWEINVVKPMKNFFIKHYNLNNGNNGEKK